MEYNIKLKLTKQSEHVIFSTSTDDNYLFYTIIALKRFQQINEGFDAYVIGKNYSDENKKLLDKYNIGYVEGNFDTKFYKSWEYPAECYYWIFGPEIFKRIGYKFSIYIDGDIFAFRQIDIKQLLDTKFIKGIPRNSIGVSLRVDYKKISNLYNGKVLRENLKRIQVGVLFLNNEEISKRNFLEEISDLYDFCIKNEIPRKGDDSLLAMYYLVNDVIPEYLLDEYNVILPETDQKYNVGNIINFHFGLCLKPWKKNFSKLNRITSIFDFFHQKWLDFVLDNMSKDEIERHLPQCNIKYPDISKKINFYWYPQINVGDMLTKYYLEKFCSNKFNFINLDKSKEKCIISTGSIMRLANNRTLVYGSGIRDVDQEIDTSNFKSVRGPITKENVSKKGYCPDIYGDPALLLKFYYTPKPSKKRYTLGIIPHFTEFKEINEHFKHDELESKSVKIIDFNTDDVEHIIDEICSCDKILSSSLHGIIFSHAYDIPVRWIRFSSKIRGDGTKFDDHFLATIGEKKNFIDATNFKNLSLDDFLSYEIPKVDIIINLKTLKDTMFFDESGIKTSTYYAYEKL